jgi:pyruvate carboxylase
MKFTPYSTDAAILFPAMKVGVPCVPGTPGPVANYHEGADFVQEHGFPGIFSIIIP